MKLSLSTLLGSRRAHRERKPRKFHFESLERKDVPAGAVLPSGFTESILATNLPSTNMMVVAPDGRVFMSELSGNIRVYENGQVSQTLVANLPTSPKVGQGILGMALDPNFESNGYMYVFRVIDSGSKLRDQLSRITISGNQMVDGSEKVLFRTPAFSFVPGAPDHNGGGITFGSDGKIYIPMGDLGNGKNAQNMRSLGGKILRLNPDGSIPRNNPFYRRTVGVYRSIYASGMRNPYTVAAQPGSNLIYANDVGQASYEEINQIRKGGNYGWPNSEGYKGLKRRFTAPVYAYSHNAPDTNPGGTAIVGGAFYNVASPEFPSTYVGKYFFGDYHNGWIKMLDPATKQVSTFASGLPMGTVDIDATPDGRLLYLSLDADTGQTQLRQIAYSPASAPTLNPLNDQTVAIGRNAIFTASPSGTGPFTYEWYINGQYQAWATTDTMSLTANDLSLSGAKIQAVVTNAYGASTSNVATMAVLNDQPPQAVITQPAAVTRYPGGSLLSFAGYGVDAEDGTLTASSMKWSIDLMHNEHVHPGVFQLTGKTSGQLRVPKHSDEGVIRLRVNLTVTDSAGISTTTSMTLPVRG